jgi:hypothetical protein
MKFRKAAVANPQTDSREEVREIAEALSLYRSAMHHLAERETARPFVAERPHARTIGLRSVLAPALAAAIAVAALVPVYTHYRHNSPPVPRMRTEQPSAADTRATVDDTALMNQIDSELSEDVPDALRPLADLSDQTTTNNSSSEKKNVTQE